MDTLELLKQAIFSKRPELAEILKNSGDEILLNYAKKYPSNITDVDAALKLELISAVSAETEMLYGPETAASVDEQLNKFYYISTTDHHGPISHPFFVQSDLLSSVRDNTQNGLNNLIVLACSNISLNNSSEPRRFLFHKTNETFEFINFFPSKFVHQSVFGMRAIKYDDLTNMKNQIHNKYSGEKALHEKLIAFVEQFYESEQILKLNEYGKQISVSNNKIWENIFPGQKLNNLVYLQLEKVVIRLLLNRHLTSKTMVNSFILDKDVLEQVEFLFNGIPGSFDKQNMKGTFLFWYIPGDKVGIKIPLWRNGNELVSADAKYRIPITPDGLGDALREGKLIPSNMLSMAILSCYYRIKCLGGFSQTTYLRRIQTAWNTIFEKNKNDERDYSTLCGDFTIATIKIDNKHLPATGLDFYLYGNSDSYEHFIKNAQTLTLEQTMLPLLPELYKILYPARERTPELSSISTSEITEMLIRENKLTSCLDTSNL
ncbi:hypothetical protein KGQ24_02825 [Patescibacteria group bacterium]|nr:hypothetical protein [Patescibacteria group bacterium]